MVDSLRVTVITAAYNRSNVLRYSVGSVLSQTLADFELLVIGDACTDDSESIVRAFDDARVRWHNLPERFGSQSGPNNRGLELARSPYVAYLGQDDLWLPGHLENLAGALDRGDADLVFSLAAVVLPDGGRRLTGLLPGDSFSTNDFVVPTSLMHRRELYERVGPWPDHREVRLPIDAEWQQRALAAGCRFEAVERLTAFKFPSTSRPRSYVDRPCDDQALLSRRIKLEPELELTELVALLRSGLDQPLSVVRPPVGVHAPAGWFAEQILAQRGIGGEHQPPTPPIPDSVTAEHLRVRAGGVAGAWAGGERRVIPVTLENLSPLLLTSTAPDPVYLSYRWYDDDGLVVPDGLRSVLALPLEAGGAQEIGVLVESPNEPGRHFLQLLVVQEHVRWFDHPGFALAARLEVEVTG